MKYCNGWWDSFKRYYIISIHVVCLIVRRESHKSHRFRIYKAQEAFLSVNANNFIHKCKKH